MFIYKFTNSSLRSNDFLQKSLLLSIIPADTAEDLERDIRERIELIKAGNLHRKNAVNTR